MKKYLPIYIYGALIILVGLFLSLSVSGSLRTISYTLGITLIGGAGLAFFAALSRLRKQVQFSYHELHALAMVVYGITVLLFSNSLEKLISFTTLLLLFYTFSEIIFCIWLFNLKQHVVFKIVIIRLFLGLVVGLGTVFAMINSDVTLEIFGLLFIIIGINIILYVPIMKIKEIRPKL